MKRSQFSEGPIVYALRQAEPPQLTLLAHITYSPVNTFEPS
jgi:hypothetical protein